MKDSIDFIRKRRNSMADLAGFFADHLQKIKKNTWFSIFE